MSEYTYIAQADNEDNNIAYNLIYEKGNIETGLDAIKKEKDAMDEDANEIYKLKNKLEINGHLQTAVSKNYVYTICQAFDELLYRTKKLSIGEWDKHQELSIDSVEYTNDKYNLTPGEIGAAATSGVSFERIECIINFIKNRVEEYDETQKKDPDGKDLNQILRDIFIPGDPYKNYKNFLSNDDYSITEEEYNTFLTKSLYLFKLKHKEDLRIKDWDITIYKDFLEYGDNDINKFISEKTNSDSDVVELQEPTLQGTPPSLNDGGNQFNSSKTVEETNTNTETTDTGKTDTDKSDDNSNSDTGKTEPTKDTDTKDSDKTFENKPKPDNPPIISDNKGSSGVSHGGLSSNNGKGNYTFTNSGISASQDEPIEILTDEKPGDDQITSLPDDNEDIYTIPTDLSGVTSTKKHSSGGGSSVIPILGGLGAAAAVGVGAKIYMDNKKNNDNDEDSSESDDNTEDLNETSNENDGILADEWNEDDSNFEFDDSEPNMDDDESGFSEI